jgi:Delta7-sterol 5-desaturase
MDFLLSVADDLLFDKLWAKLVPLSAFASSPDFLSSVNATSNYLPIGSSSKWTEFVAALPHPPISPTTLSSYTSSGVLPNVSAWPRDYIPRQLLSLTLLTMVGVHIMYFLFAGFSYYFVFNHEMKKHPKYLKDQIKLEIQASLKAFPPLMLLHLPIFQAEVMGYSKLYDGIDTYGYFYFFASVPL